MNHPGTPHRDSRPSPERPAQSGVALVLVLGMLVLITVLAVAFLSSMATERRSADSYASALDVRVLADSAVNVVIAQIQEATSTPTLAWASQPGMIRTYDSDGQEVDAFKLFSSDTLKVSGGYHATNQSATELPADWAARPAQFTDLNRPVYVGNRPHYPVISPTAVATSAGAETALEGGQAPVEGCYISASPALAVGPDQPNALPLPVRWLYLMENGAMGVPNDQGQITGATADNPIVGRIAFWTDDESGKININTAAEGTFWDRPYAESPSGGGTSWAGYERGFLGYTLPAQNEFQRYPGHPATTSLSVVFPPLEGETAVDYNERVYGIAPRVIGGGSESGTVQVTRHSAIPVPDADRLFTSVDEFLFKPTMTASREVNLKGPNTPFTESDVERTRFFLTASSRAPEVNLFNKPRITLWPLQVDPDPNTGDATRTAKDKLIAFCSTVGDQPYYFQRYNTYRFDQNTRGTGDYLATMQSPPPSSQSTTLDWEEVPRNRELYAYLQNLTSNPIPGLGGALGGSGGKYNAGTRDQILTQMFDYVRSSLNSATTGAQPQYFYAPGSVGSSYRDMIGERQIVPVSLPNGTKGFGRFPSVKQAAVVFYRQDTEFGVTHNANGTTSVAQPLPPYHIGAVLILDPFNVTPGTLPWTTNLRYVVRGLDNFTIKENGSGTPAEIRTPFANPAVNLLTARDGMINATALTGLEYSFKHYSEPHKDSPKTLGPTVVGSADEEKHYPFYADFTLNAGTRFDFSGGDVVIEVYSGYAKTLRPEDLVQTIHMSFPAATGLPIPSSDYSKNAEGIPTAKNTNYDDRIAAKGIETAYYHSPRPLVTGLDVVRSVEARYGGPAKGDLRVYSALKTVPADYFEGHGLVDTPDDGVKYTDQPNNLGDRKSRIHSLRGCTPSNISTVSAGHYAGAFNQAKPTSKLVAGVNYYYGTGNPKRLNGTPIVPRGLPAALMSNGAPGDWDTGPGNQSDGPYINKADEGASSILTNQYDYGSYFMIGTNANLLDEQGSSYSPNRQCYSPVMFGSLPTGIDPSAPDNVKPWQTLLFNANPAAGADHPGFGSPASGPGYTEAPDHAFLDLFTMPVVEPYAISEPFSTAGKINMNYQIVPFTYLTRNTGLRAVLKSVKMMAIPTGHGQIYKISGNNPPDYRYAINPDESTGTLAGFEERFARGDIFRSASEICDISLVPGEGVDGSSPPGNPKYSSMDTWWQDYQLTGDNLREIPYGYLYPRLTTKSNTYTVHVTAQSLRKAAHTSDGEFVEGRDLVTGEFRGAFIIQRYLDPNSDSLVGADGKTPADENDADAMVGPYKFRVVSSKRFDP